MGCTDQLNKCKMVSLMLWWFWVPDSRFSKHADSLNSVKNGVIRKSYGGRVAARERAGLCPLLAPVENYRNNAAASDLLHFCRTSFICCSLR